MIHVNKQQLKQVRYLLGQSVQGNHVLFDPEDLKRVLRSMETRLCPLTEEEAYATEPHLERLLAEPSLEQKRSYLRGLPAREYERVVMTYFTILDNDLLKNAEARH